jgi:signal transduction histidine kinase
MSLLLMTIILLSLLSVSVLLIRIRSDHRHRLFSEHITNKMPSGLITVNRQGKITGHNPASERIFEGTLASASMLPLLVRESRKLQELLDRCVTSEETFSRVELNVPIAENNFKRIGVNLSPITNVHGKVEGAICLLSDLTEIVELQDQIKLKENFAALGEMSAGIAHEFKNSIATILGYAQMSSVERDVKTLQNYAREILKESQALSNMVTEFLNFARPVTANIYTVDLIDLLETVITDFKNLRPGKYKIQFKQLTEAIVPCDATLMRQSFLNLLINAAEALENGEGTVSVLVEGLRDDHVRVIIEDDGRGIPNHQLAKIFFPFFTTKPHGTGLGLSLVQKIIIAHNGRIEVQSTEGKGTRFTVILPLNRDNPS